MSEDEKIAIAKAIVAELEAKGLVLGMTLQEHIEHHIWVGDEKKRNEESAKAIRTGVISVLIAIGTAIVLFIGKIVMEIGKHIDLNAVWKAVSGGQ